MGTDTLRIIFSSLQDGDKAVYWCVGLAGQKGKRRLEVEELLQVGLRLVRPRYPLPWSKIRQMRKCQVRRQESSGHSIRSAPVPSPGLSVVSNVGPLTLESSIYSRVRTLTHYWSTAVEGSGMMEFRVSHLTNQRAKMADHISHPCGVCNERRGCSRQSLDGSDGAER